jgi:hypothetical protein
MDNASGVQVGYCEDKIMKDYLDSFLSTGLKRKHMLHPLVKAHSFEKFHHEV